VNKATTAAFLVLAAGVAHADEPGAIVTNTATPAAGPGWSDQIIDNGLVLPPSAIGVYGDLDVTRVTFTAPPIPPATMGIITTDTALDLLAGVGYGVNDLVTIGGQWQLPLDNGQGAFGNAGVITAYGGYSLTHDDKLAVVAGGDFSVAFAGSATAFLHAGVSLRYRLAPKLIFYSGNPLAPGPYGQQITVGLNNSAPVSIDLPVGLGWQVNPKAFAWAQTAVAHIKLANTENAFIFADYIPLEIGALFRAKKDIDVGGYLSFPDLEHAGDFFGFGVLLRYYKH